MMDYLDSFDLQPLLPTDLPTGTMKHDLVTLMMKIGMPRDPQTWLHWQDVYFPDMGSLPDGWTRLWDETSRRIVCYRVLDGYVHLRPWQPEGGLPSIELNARRTLERTWQQERLCRTLAPAPFG